MDEPTKGWVNVDEIEKFRQVLSYNLANNHILKERLRSALGETTPHIRRIRILKVLREVGYE